MHKVVLVDITHPQYAAMPLTSTFVFYIEHPGLINHFLLPEHARIDFHIDHIK